MNSPPERCDPAIETPPAHRVEPWIALTTRSIAGKKSAKRKTVRRFASR
jgi:hypothetical protein